MSIEENKRIHKRFIEEIWMGGNPDAVDEIVGDALTGDWGDGNTITKEQLRKMAGIRPIIDTEFHEIVGEGDIVVAWKTQKKADGTTEEGVTFWKFESGKIVAFKWFPVKSD